MNYKQTVYCTFAIDGTHNWANIPDVDYLSDVQFLKLPHRHMFHFKCYAEVGHADRDIEFIVMKRDLQTYIDEKYYDGEKRSCVFGSMSCEHIACELLDNFEYLTKVEVNEDNENGAIVER